MKWSVQNLHKISQKIGRNETKGYVEKQTVTKLKQNRTRKRMKQENHNTIQKNNNSKYVNRNSQRQRISCT